MNHLHTFFLIIALGQVMSSFGADGWRGPLMRRLNPSGFYTDPLTTPPRHVETTNEQAFLARKRTRQEEDSRHQRPVKGLPSKGQPSQSASPGTQVGTQPAQTFVSAPLTVALPEEDDFDEKLTPHEKVAIEKIEQETGAHEKPQ